MTSPSESIKPPRPALTAGERAGLGYAVGAYVIWAVTPLYFKAVLTASAFEIVMHRVVWCVVFLVLVITVARQWGEVRAAVSSRRVLATLLATALLVSVNWTIFIYTIESSQLIASSLGYFLSPLVSVLLGFVILRERLNTSQWIAAGIAGVAVAIKVVAFGSLPWIGLTIAFCFGVYGLLRKAVAAGPAVGLFVECLVLAPFCLAWLVWLDLHGHSHFSLSEPWFALLLAAAGPVTGIPLLLYAAGARRVKLATMGLLQFIIPATYLGLAFNDGEAFGTEDAITFVLIWLALAIYVRDMWRTRSV
ncbi:MAG: EamA family transporter RarD [Alphaproteobacteria bacterium]